MRRGMFLALFALGSTLFTIFAEEMRFQVKHDHGLRSCRGELVLRDAKALLFKRSGQTVAEGCFKPGYGGFVLRAFGTCKRRFHSGEVEFNHVFEERIGSLVGAEESLLFGIALDQIH